MRSFRWRLGASLLLCSAVLAVAFPSAARPVSAEWGGGGSGSDLGNSADAFVNDAYTALLLRAADSAGLRGWSDAIQNGSMKRDAVALALVNSGEYRRKAINAIYHALLDRSVDLGGLAAFAPQLASGGMTYEQLRAVIAGSPEYARHHSATTHWALVNAWYTDLLGRPANAAAATWVARLNAGEAPVNVVMGIATSAEARGRVVAAGYLRYLGRTVEAAGLASWTKIVGLSLRDEIFAATLVMSGEWMRKHQLSTGASWPLARCPVATLTRYSDDYGAGRAGGIKHEGNDVLAPAGTPIRAPFDGYAVRVDNNLGGIAVIVRGRDGYVYNAHMISVGTLGAVHAGTVIGYVGNTGASSGVYHDHFEWHPRDIPPGLHVSPYGDSQLGTTIDPYPFLRQVC